MFLSSFFFGRTLHSAIVAFNEGRFAEAENLVEEALVINNHDFEANFLKMRIAVMQQKYEKAMVLINVCKKIKIASKLNQLLAPWEEYCSIHIGQPPEEGLDVIKLNEKTDELLRFYQHNREYKISDLVWITVLFIVLTFSMNYLLEILFHISMIRSNAALYMFTLLYLPIVSYYYFRKVTLIPNVYILLRYGINTLRGLFKSKRFINSVLTITLGLTMLFTSGLIKRDLHTRFLEIVAIVLAGPIEEEILIRGFLYGYLRKYGKVLSWSLVTIVFCLLHGESASSWQAIVSIACLNVYDQEKTILAPIIIHMLNNGVNILLAFL
ncbi:caax protease self-immunity [Lucifera butyrica]|uniref:Caax protease self-immunity n=1 Tax=Lucifera butyrica TaxID=1351585 RepID=A0A498R789_9FIRM|nr:CPBP family glutamic-type intramembrane protease [Lucifera butyrica]VBB06132.1 caax protease self-immunity [Lucifera butyrica]